MSEYKEFWIDNSNETNKNFFLYNVKRGVMNYNFDGAIHVIEYEAFEELKSEIHNIRTHLISECKNHKETQLEIEKLKKQNEILREALSFYADIDSWDCPTGLYDVTAIVDDESTNYYSDVAGDFDDVGGKRARQALKDVEGVG